MSFDQRAPKLHPKEKTMNRPSIRNVVATAIGLPSITPDRKSGWIV